MARDVVSFLIVSDTYHPLDLTILRYSQYSLKGGGMSRVLFNVLECMTLFCTGMFIDLDFNMYSFH